MLLATQGHSRVFRPGRASIRFRAAPHGTRLEAWEQGVIKHQQRQASNNSGRRLIVSWRSDIQGRVNLQRR